MAEGRIYKPKFWEIAPRAEDESSREYRCLELIHKFLYLFYLFLRLVSWVVALVVVLHFIPASEFIDRAGDFLPFMGP